MLETILLVVSVLLIVIVLLQSNKASFKNMKERGAELFISRLTLALGIVFFIISFILFLK